MMALSGTCDGDHTSHVEPAAEPRIAVVSKDLQRNQIALALVGLVIVGVIMRAV